MKAAFDKLFAHVGEMTRTQTHIHFSQNNYSNQAPHLVKKHVELGHKILPVVFFYSIESLIQRACYEVMQVLACL